MCGLEIPHGAIPQADAGAEPHLDLLSRLPRECLAKLRVRVVGRPWTEHAKLLKSAFGWTVRDALRKDSLPVPQYLAVEDKLPVVRADLLLLSGRGSGHSTLPAVFRLTPDFCRLVGYFLSEGCITVERGRPRLRRASHGQRSTNH